MNLDNKKFKTITNTEGLSSEDTIFFYHQHEDVITGSYKGGQVEEGFIVGKQLDHKTIQLLFQCITKDKQLLCGESRGIISINASEKLELTFDWNWLNGDRSGGTSHYVEIDE